MFYLIYQTIFTDSIKKPYWQLMEVKKQLRLNMYSLEKKVRERTRDLAAQKKELERLNRLKTDLLAVCSHDMKSPIQGTILMLDLLMMEAGKLTAEQKKTLESIPEERGGDNGPYLPTCSTSPGGMRTPWPFIPRARISRACYMTGRSGSESLRTRWK
jgi:hypothetical protein